MGTPRAAAAGAAGGDRIPGLRRQELRLAHIVALLRRGGYRMDGIAAVVAQMRSSQASLPERVRAELARREVDLQRRSWERLRASATLFAYMERM